MLAELSQTKLAKRAAEAAPDSSGMSGGLRLDCCGGKLVVVVVVVVVTVVMMVLVIM